MDNIPVSVLFHYVNQRTYNVHVRTYNVHTNVHIYIQLCKNLNAGKCINEVK